MTVDAVIKRWSSQPYKVRSVEASAKSSKTSLFSPKSMSSKSEIEDEHNPAVKADSK